MEEDLTGKGGEADTDAHPLIRDPVLETASPPQGGGGNLGHRWVTGSLEQRRGRVLRGCFHVEDPQSSLTWKWPQWIQQPLKVGNVIYCPPPEDRGSVISLKMIYAQRATTHLSPRGGRDGRPAEQRRENTDISPVHGDIWDKTVRVG